MKLRPFYAVLEREVLRMIRQRTRLVAAMVRPLHLAAGDRRRLQRRDADARTA